MTIDAPADGLKKLSVKDVFADDRYRVPLYQRAYAWTMTEIHTLLIDIQDARKNSLRNGTDPDPRDSAPWRGGIRIVIWSVALINEFRVWIITTTGVEGVLLGRDDGSELGHGGL